MTLLHNSQQSPGTAAPEGVAARAPAPDAVKQAHADERWSRAAVEATNRSNMGRRSAGIIGSVIAVGVLAWLIVTLL